MIRFITKKAQALANIFELINQVPVFMAIRQGLALMIPLMIFGSIAIFLTELPIEAYQKAMLSLFGENWKSVGGYIVQATFGIVSLAAGLMVGYALVVHKAKAQDINPMMGALVSITCLVALTHTGESFLSWLGTRGMFITFFTAFLSTELYLLLCRIKRFRINLISNAANNYLNAAVSTLIPFCITLTLFAVTRLLLGMIGIADIQTSMYNALSSLFSDTNLSLGTSVILQALIHIFWFIGIHGAQAFTSVENEVLVPALQTNIDLVAAGSAPTEIINLQFFNSFVYLGGSGAAICLILALFIAVRRSNIRRVGAVGFFPALINVNEIVIFGVPVVLNFFLFIPMILVPIVLTVITYLAMAWGIVPMTTNGVDWTTPVLISGYYSTGGSMRGVLLQAFNLCVGVGLYIPFVRLYDRSLSRDNERVLSDLMTTVTRIGELRRTVLLDRIDAKGNMARMLASDLKLAMGTKELALHYQPLIDNHGKVYCVESLLRWTHPQLGLIPPPIAIAIAEESDFIHELGLHIFESAVKALKEFSRLGLDIDISVNITPTQLNDPLLVEKFSNITTKYDVSAKRIVIEITEQTALEGLAHMKALQELRDANFSIAIDDFGMGHSSLTYLKDLSFDILKIDGALVREIETNNSCRDIISSITTLGRSMDIKIVAEFVENEGQRKLLQDLGCMRYQGYLYSPALPSDKAAEYIKKFSGTHS